MHTPRSNRYRLTPLLAVVALGVCAWLWLTPSGRKLCCARSYKTSVSPDQRFRVEVFGISTPLPMMPGSAGDTPGFVRLQTREGKVLREQDIAAVQLVEQIRWSHTRVDIPLIVEWPLPAAVAAPAGSAGN